MVLFNHSKNSLLNVSTTFDLIYHAPLVRNFIVSAPLLFTCFLVVDPYADGINNNNNNKKLLYTSQPNRPLFIIHKMFELFESVPRQRKSFACVWKQHFYVNILIK